MSENAAAFFLVITWLCFVWYIISEARKNDRLLERQDFYRGIKPGHRKKKSFSYWLPLFLHRRRRPEYKLRVRTKMCRV